MQFKTNIYSVTVLASVLFLCLPAFAARKANGRAGKSKAAKSTVTKVTGAHKDYTLFAGAVKKAGLEKMLNARGPFTIFAPTDAAFRRVDQTALNRLFNDPNKLRAFLLQHVVSANIGVEHVALVSEIETMSGSYLKLSHTEDNGLRVNDAAVVSLGKTARNGVVHGVDQMLIDFK